MSHVLLVDLNNFARFPTLSIGYLSSVLRGAGHQVSVYAPLMVGVRGVTREVRPGRFSLALAKANYRLASSGLAGIRQLRERVASGRRSQITQHEDKVVEGFRAELAKAVPAVVMISTYLMYRRVCAAVCALCREKGIPVVIGGPYFAQPETIEDWMRIPGLTALAAGEVELHMPRILEAVLERGDPSGIDGVIVPRPAGGMLGRIAPPLQDLDRVPFPDYSDFPWHAYPNRIVPIVTGRGCGWGVCTFCSDVTSTAGRTFRSRSPGNVLQEVQSHHQRYGVDRFVFTDLKLNSDVQMWRSLTGAMQRVVPGARWIGAVHVGRELDNGLSAPDLRAASEAGCVRLTTGLETGSQRIADAMKKGTSIDRVSGFLHDASAAGISCRCTMVLGHPGETPDDVHASAAFLEQHRGVIERVSLNRLQLITGTGLHRAMQRQPAKLAGISIVKHEPGLARIEHHNRASSARAHRKAVMRLLTAVHRINEQPLSERAREFEGVM